MLLKTHFKKLRLVQHVQSILRIDDKPYLIFIALLTSCSVSQAFAQNAQPPLPTVTTVQQDQNHLVSSNTTDSMQLLQQQQQNPALTDFKPVDLGDLEQLPAIAVDPSMAQQILNEAAQAKQQAETNRQQGSPVSNQISAQTMQILNDTKEQPVQVSQMIDNIQNAHDQDLAQARANEANSQATRGAIFNDTTFELEPQQPPEKNIFKRWFNRLKPGQNQDTFVIPKITAEVEGAPPALATNIKNKLSTFTQEAFEDESSAIPQLRAQVQQAAQAVGYYNAKFKFERLSNKSVKVIVEPNQPVIVDSQNIEFFGAGKNLAQFQVIRLLPDLEIGDILDQGKYERTKSRITDVASDNGYFDAYWKLHDLKIMLPENKADINLRYDTGERYTLGDVEFRMSDPKKSLPLRMNVLKSMIPWDSGDDYAFWRVNTLANNLTNSRYFNWSLVETIKPDPISKPLELPPDIQALVDQQKITKTQAQNSVQNENSESDESKEARKQAPLEKQTFADEKGFAGTQERSVESSETSEQQASDSNDKKAQVRQSKKVPVIVTINADQLNSAEVGAGFGTDTGFRVRTQYRRAIVNSYGHSFDANMEVSKIRQAVDTHYTIPYKHPINDYFNLVSGYEREEFKGVGPGMSLTTETAIAGAERVIRNPFGGWQHTFGFRYRLDKIHQIGDVNASNVPNAFLRPGSSPEQQALLLGYQLSRTDSNDPLNPVKGFKQSYKIQLASKSVISDANMAILNTDWTGIYSLGVNYNHQFIAGAHLAYIFTDDFINVPYNLRFFAGGDQSLRGFDYKNLSPEEGGYKIGGQALAVGSLEYNYQFKEGWRAAAFTDFGNAYNKDFSNPIAYSVGLGIRWKSPIGPIRLDIASGISDPGHPIRLHFFIGSQL